MKQKLLPILLLVALICTGQTPPNAPTTTYGSVNGRFWRQADRPARGYYLWGLQDGLNQASDTAVHTFFPKGLTIGEVMEALDRFYADPENVLIAVVFALPLLTGRANGAPQATFEKLLALARAHALDAPEHHKDARP